MTLETLPVYMGSIATVEGKRTDLSAVREFADNPPLLRALRDRGHRTYCHYRGSCADMLDELLAKVGREEGGRTYGGLILNCDVDRNGVTEVLVRHGIGDVPIFVVRGAQCASSIAAIRVASGLLGVNDVDRILCLMVNKVEEGESRTFGGVTVFSDAAASFEISLNPLEYQVLAVDHRSDGEMSLLARPIAALARLQAMMKSLALAAQVAMAKTGKDVARVVTINNSAIASMIPAWFGVDSSLLSNDGIREIGHAFECDYFIALDGQDPHPDGLVLVVGVGARSAGVMVLSSHPGARR